MTSREEFEKFVLTRDPKRLDDYNYYDNTYHYLGLSNTWVNDMWLTWQEQQKKINELEQQRDELLARIIAVCRHSIARGTRHITAQKTITKITGKRWEQIKAGEK